MTNNLSLFDLDRFVDTFVRPEMFNVGGGRMPMDVLETPDAILVHVALPGRSREQVEISFEKDTLTVKAHAVEAPPAEGEPQGRWLLRERFSGPLTRSITLPIALDVEKATARFDNGVLHLTLPKSEAWKPKTIKVTE